MYYGFYFDWTYILVIIGAGLCMFASANVNSTYKKYAKIRNRSGITGAQAAKMILDAQGIYDVRIEHISGHLTDNYDPTNKVVHLSDTTYNSDSVAAVGVAAHECGHVIQHNRGYVPIAVRNAILPLANGGSKLSWVLIVAGVILSGMGTGETGMLIIRVGIIAFSMAVLFQIVTLPVEFNASSRALKILGSSGMFDKGEVKQTKKVLKAAALTYVAAAASSILQLLRLIILFGGDRRHD